MIARRKKHTEKSPDWTGSLLINGALMDVALWAKSDGMLAGAVKPKWEPDFQGVKDKIERMPPPVTIEDDEIPF